MLAEGTGGEGESCEGEPRGLIGVARVEIEPHDAVGVQLPDELDARLRKEVFERKRSLRQDWGERKQVKQI